MPVREPKPDYRAALRQEYEEISSGGRTDFWKPRKITAKNDDGDRIRIIVPPYMKPDPDFGVVLQPWVKFRIYRVPGVKTEGKDTAGVKIVVVPSDYGQPDPIADAISEMEEGSKSDRAAAKQMTPRQRFVALIEDLDNGPGKVLPWEFGPQVAEQILKYATHRDYNLPWDNEEGHDLWVRCTGEGKDTEYDVLPSPRPSPLEDVEKKMELAGKIDLARFVTIETEETLEDILDGKYDPEVARDRRDARDSLHGRPLPYFLKSSERVDEEEGDDAKPTRSRRGAPAPDKDTEKPVRASRKEVVEEVEPEKPATPSRRRKPAAPEKPAEPTIEVGSRVEFAGDDGEELTGNVTELHLDDADPYVTVDTGDGGEPWDVNVDDVKLIAPEPDTAPEPDAKPSRRRKAAGNGKAPETAQEEPSAPARSSIVDRVSQLSKNARGE